MGVHMSELRLSLLGQRRDSPDLGPGTALDDMAEQIRALDEAARRASRHIEERAQSLRGEGRRRGSGDDALLADLAETLVARADGIRADCERLTVLLDRARHLVAETVPAAPEMPSGSAGGSAWAGPAPAAPATGGRASEGVRLVATEMAIAGSTRAEIEGRLRAEFGVQDPEPVLAEIFGRTRAAAS
jgi:hypothetical protein